MFPELIRDDVFRLETARLWLAWPCAADTPGITRIASRAEVASMTARIPHPYPSDGASDWVRASRQDNASGRSLILVARDKTGRREVAALVSIDLLGDGAELGYVVKPERWGEGLASEAAAAIVAVAFAVTSLDVIHSRTRIENSASQRVLRKIGFAPAGRAMADMPARGGVFPVETFRLTRSDWLARRQADARTGYQVPANLL